jgi:hypothetical protein
MKSNNDVERIKMHLNAKVDVKKVSVFLENEGAVIIHR